MRERERERLALNRADNNQRIVAARGSIEESTKSETREETLRASSSPERTPPLPSFMAVNKSPFLAFPFPFLPLVSSYVLRYARANKPRRRYRPDGALIFMPRESSNGLRASLSLSLSLSPFDFVASKHRERRNTSWSRCTLGERELQESRAIDHS